MREYIFERPDACTLKEAKHDEYFRGEVIRCKDCKTNPYNKPASVDVVHNTPERCWDLASRKNAFCSEAEREEK